jgi:hypothetical protein
MQNGRLRSEQTNGTCDVMTDAKCEATLEEFKNLDPDAMILPEIGLPSQGNGVCTIMHGMPGAPNLKINGLESKSALANKALFSTECIGNKTLNLYEVMMPDKVSDVPGDLSSAEAYTQSLSAQGLNVAGTHFHWWGADPNVAAIHHQNVGMDPTEFVAKTINSLQII